MKRRTTRLMIAGATLLVLGATNYSIVAKERIKARGEQIFLELAPVDPRSLMQGDYMALRFALARQIADRESGSVPLIVDARRIATLNPDVNAGGLRMRYRVRSEGVWLGTNAYFFEEGTAERYSGARYGEFRVDPASGEAVLVGLRDAELREIGARR